METNIATHEPEFDPRTFCSLYRCRPTLNEIRPSSELLLDAVANDPEFVGEHVVISGSRNFSERFVRICQIARLIPEKAVYFGRPTSKEFYDKLLESGCAVIDEEHYPLLKHASDYQYKLTRQDFKDLPETSQAFMAANYARFRFLSLGCMDDRLYESTFTGTAEKRIAKFTLGMEKVDFEYPPEDWCDAMVKWGGFTDCPDVYRGTGGYDEFERRYELVSGIRQIWQVELTRRGFREGIAAIDWYGVPEHTVASLAEELMLKRKIELLYDGVPLNDIV